MPVAAGDIVAMTTWNAGVLTHHIQPQPVRFGRVEDSAGIDVLWEDGTFTQTIPNDNLLDVIQDVTVANEDLIGKVVRFVMTGSRRPSPAYDAIVVAAYRRERGGGGVLTDDLVLVRLLSNNMWYEVLADSTTLPSVTRLDDR